MNKPVIKSDLLSALFASAVAGLILSAPALADHKAGHDGKSDMYCSNGCKGTSDCSGHGNDNGCKGSNTCKGHGFKEAKNGAECKKAGGTWQKTSDEKAADKKDATKS